MTLNLGKSKFALQKKVLAFFGVVPLLLVTAWIPVPCPTCHGDGVISSYGMEHITIFEDPYVVYSTSQPIFCETWLLYQMVIILTLQNDWDQDVSGYMILSLIDPASGYETEKQHVAVKISAGNIVPQRVNLVISIPIEFTGYTAPIVLAIVPDDVHPCEICNGTGKVMLNTWLCARKKWEIHNYNDVLGEYRPDIGNIEDLEDMMMIPMVDGNGYPILDDRGFPIMVQVPIVPGMMVYAYDADGNPFLDANGEHIKVFEYLE